jgi:hypothetical protein
MYHKLDGERYVENIFNLLSETFSLFILCCLLSEQEKISRMLAKSETKKAMIFLVLRCLCGKKLFSLQSQEYS